jgi:nitrogen regulatory protein PII
MKLLLAIIRPEKLSAVQAALNHQDVSLITVSEVSSFGQEKGPVEIYRGRTVQRPVSKFRVEVMVNDSYLDAAVLAIRGAGFSSDVEPTCDDKLFVMGLAKCV